MSFRRLICVICFQTNSYILSWDFFPAVKVKLPQEQCLETKILGIPCGFLTGLLGSHGMGIFMYLADVLEKVGAWKIQTASVLKHQFDIDLCQNDVKQQHFLKPMSETCMKHMKLESQWVSGWQSCSTDPFIMTIIIVVATQSGMPYTDEQCWVEPAFFFLSLTKWSFEWKSLSLRNVDAACCGYTRLGTPMTANSIR